MECRISIFVYSISWNRIVMHTEDKLFLPCTIHSHIRKRPLKVGNLQYFSRREKKKSAHRKVIVCDRICVVRMPNPNTNKPLLNAIVKFLYIYCIFTCIVYRVYVYGRAQLVDILFLFTQSSIMKWCVHTLFSLL